MAYTPYQLAGPISELINLYDKEKLTQSETALDTSKHQVKMQENLENEIKLLKEQALKKKDKHKGLIKGGKLLATLFGGPIAAAVVGGIGEGISMDKQKGAAESLLNKSLKERYGKTFLKPQSEDYWQQALESQVSSGDVLRSGIFGGIESFAKSQLFGGESGSSPFKKFREGRKAAKLMPEVEKGFKEYISSKEMDAYQDYISESVGESPLSFDDWIKDWEGSGESLMDKEQWAKINLKDKGFKPSMLNINKDILQSKTPGLSNIWEIISQGEGLEGAEEKMQSAYMIPTFLQLLLGD